MHIYTIRTKTGMDIHLIPVDASTRDELHEARYELLRH